MSDHTLFVRDYNNSPNIRFLMNNMKPSNLIKPRSRRLGCFLLCHRFIF